MFLTHVAGDTSGYGGLAGAVLARTLWVVCAFFILSGFLLYRPWVAARVSDAPAPGVAGYLRHRAVRIGPGYWAALLILSVFPGLPQLSGPFGHRWWVYWGFLQVYRTHWILGGIGQAWTVDIELSFYLLLPVYHWGAEAVCRRWGFHRGVRVELAALFALASLSVGYRVILATPLSQRILLYTLPAWFAWFAIGMGLALVSVELQTRSLRPRWLRLLRRWPAVSWALAAALLVWLAEGFGIPPGFALFLPLDHRQVLAEYGLEAVIATLVVLPAIFAADHDGFPQRALRSWPLMRLGVISYGVYLWHSAIVREFAALGAARWLPLGHMTSLAIPSAVVSLLAGVASYRLVELPFLKRKWGRLRSSAATIWLGRAPQPGARR